MNVTKYNKNIIVPTRQKLDDHSDTSIILLTPNNLKMRNCGPKSLMKLYQNITLLDYQIDVLKTVYPSSDIILCVGEESDKVLKYKAKHVRIIENQLFNQTNEVESVRLGLNAITTEKAIIINSDVVFDKSIMRFIKDMTQSCLIYDTTGKCKDSEIGIVIAEGLATLFSFASLNKWCNIVYLMNNDLTNFQKICSDKSKKKHYLFEALNVLLDTSKVLAKELPSSIVYRIDNHKDLERVKNEITHTHI